MELTAEQFMPDPARPSSIPIGTILPVHHYVTDSPNLVKVGKVSTYRSATKTVKQPVYLRQGYGIFLKKPLKPRRDHYGRKTRRLRFEYPDNGADDDECGGVWTKILFVPGVVMTSKAITIGQAPKKLWRGRDTVTFSKLDLPLQRRQDMDAAIECLPDVQGIVRHLTPVHYTPLLPMTGRYVLYDAEWRKAIRFPNSVFVPHSPLPSPELTSGDGSTESLCEIWHKNLRTPRSIGTTVPASRAKSQKKLSESADQTVTMTSPDSSPAMEAMMIIASLYSSSLSEGTWSSRLTDVAEALPNGSGEEEAALAGSAEAEAALQRASSSDLPGQAISVRLCSSGLPEVETTLQESSSRPREVPKTSSRQSSSTRLPEAETSSRQPSSTRLPGAETSLRRSSSRLPGEKTAESLPQSSSRLPEAETSSRQSSSKRLPEAETSPRQSTSRHLEDPSANLGEASASASHTLRAGSKRKHLPPPLDRPFSHTAEVVCSGRDSHPSVRVTSARVQGDLVDVGNLFPYGAEKGLLAEFQFYESDRNYPLLLTRNSEVDLADFESQNHIRVMAPDRVKRVAALTKRSAELNARIAEYMADNSDEEETVLKDHVFNPLKYSFNKKAYKTIYTWAKAHIKD